MTTTTEEERMAVKERYGEATPYLAAATGSATGRREAIDLLLANKKAAELKKIQAQANSPLDTLAALQAIQTPQAGVRGPAPVNTGRGIIQNKMDLGTLIQGMMQGQQQQGVPTNLGKLISGG